MIEVRRAVAADAAEIVRLRTVMLGAMAGEPVPDGPWQELVGANLRRLLADPAGDFAAYVVAGADGVGLLACAVGVIDVRLGGPLDPSGRTGYVSNVVTEPGHRRRGLSRACLSALLEWFAGRGVTSVDLRATEDGAPLYRELGFRPVDHPGMRLRTGRR
ncbi:GNAT family N-acetyltransferase [Catellatospora sp. KI3]|uniref:GNAT family N-acetyltransferase n=1 Tax=Catellatospora sp. KI3 TaxID=3041620 RepID=UPI0024824BFF|nr:GNAT family N-acetyltransferase [Catellatospora sp. KI3]MDI1462059.1 GNAT family N-acetyltransferase [Catellatospora sp. KI3]